MSSNISHIVSALNALAAQLAETSGADAGSSIPANDEGQTSRIAPLHVATAIVECRKRRAKFHPSFFFGEPCWDMLLDLFIAREQQTDLTVTRLCNASQVPYATALRYLGKLESMGDVTRDTDERDHRRVIVRISDAAADRMRASLNDMTNYSDGHAQPPSIRSFGPS